MLNEKDLNEKLKVKKYLDLKQRFKNRETKRQKENLKKIKDQNLKNEKTGKKQHDQKEVNIKSTNNSNTFETSNDKEDEQEQEFIENNQSDNNKNNTALNANPNKPTSINHIEQNIAKYNN